MEDKMKLGEENSIRNNIIDAHKDILQADYQPHLLISKREIQVFIGLTSIINTHTLTHFVLVAIPFSDGYRCINYLHRTHQIVNPFLWHFVYNQLTD